MKKSSLKFTNPIITKLEYEINAINDEKENDAIKISNTFKVNIKRSEEEKEAVVELNIIIGAKENNEAPFYVDMVMGAIFKWDDSYDENTVKDLLSINAPALLLGYARPIIATITNMSPFPAYNLPFYNFTE